jgi:hypothetical protein
MAHAFSVSSDSRILDEHRCAEHAVERSTLSPFAESSGGGLATLSWDCDIEAVSTSSVCWLQFAAVLDVAVSAFPGG